VKRVLIADDDAAICEMLREFLSRDGYGVTAVQDGRQALEALQSEAVDLLILDINMPELGGASLVEMLRQDPEWERFANLPIIVISALWDVVSFDLNVQAGFAKPIPYEEVRAKIEELIGPP
jgi:CheY-like chemotaxis protein